jgi:hypothetical protein
MYTKKKTELNIGSLQPGDIIFFHSPFRVLKPLSWLSFFIRFFQQCYWNHCGIVGFDSMKKLTLIEATEKGVVENNLKKSLFGCNILIKRKITVNQSFHYQYNLAANRAHACLRTPYDFASCLIFQLIKQSSEILLPSSIVWLGRSGSAAAKRFYCSELVAFCWELPCWWLIAPDDLEHNSSFETIYSGIVFY